MSFSLDLDPYRERVVELLDRLDPESFVGSPVVHGLSLYLEPADRLWLAEPAEGEEATPVSADAREVLIESVAVALLWAEATVAARDPEAGVPDDAAPQIITDVEEVMSLVDELREVHGDEEELVAAFARADERMTAVLEAAMAGLDRTPLPDPSEEVEEPEPALAARPMITLRSFVSEARAELTALLREGGDDFEPLIALPSGEIHGFEPAEREALDADIERETSRRLASEHHLLALTSALSYKVAVECGLLRGVSPGEGVDPGELAQGRVALEVLDDFLRRLRSWAAAVGDVPLLTVIEPVQERQAALTAHLAAHPDAGGEPAADLSMSLTLDDFQGARARLGEPATGASAGGTGTLTGAGTGTARVGSSARNPTWSSSRTGEVASGGRRAPTPPPLKRSKTRKVKDDVPPPSAAASSRSAPRRREPTVEPLRGGGAPTSESTLKDFLKAPVRLPRKLSGGSVVILVGILALVVLVPLVRWLTSPMGPGISDAERNAIFHSDLNYFFPSARWGHDPSRGPHVVVGSDWMTMPEDQLRAKLRSMCAFPNIFSEEGAFYTEDGRLVARCVNGRPDRM